jgi:3D (Asp-Asp-Asp) domain-containing protein
MLTSPIEDTNEAQAVHTQIKNTRHSRTGRVVSAEMTLWLCALTLAITSAIWTKERGTLPALAGIGSVETAESTDTRSTGVPPVVFSSDVEDSKVDDSEDTGETPVLPVQDQAIALDSSIRWFDGKMIRPARVIYMTITGYSPDERSCGKFADNKTATMYSVWTNGMNLVAADPTVLPYWSMVSIPGYANDDIVPVLDCGGAIKGNRIDLLYPTHELARVWGVRQMPVTVWEFVEEE